MLRIKANNRKLKNKENVINIEKELHGNEKNGGKGRLSKVRHPTLITDKAQAVAMNGKEAKLSQ